jgi:hypothetical protein
MTKRELAEKRIDKMGFDEQEKKVIFLRVNKWHTAWLLVSTEAEINAWFEVVNKKFGNRVS